MRHSCASMPRDNKTTGRSIMADAMRSSMVPAHGSSPSHSPTALALQGFAPETAGFAPRSRKGQHISSVLSNVEPAGNTAPLPEAAGSEKCWKIRRFQTSGGHPAQQTQGLEKNHGSLRFWREFCILERKSERKKRERSAGKRLSRWPINSEVRFHDR